jgi:hypothetical protein
MRISEMLSSMSCSFYGLLVSLYRYLRNMIWLGVSNRTTGVAAEGWKEAQDAGGAGGPKSPLVFLRLVRPDCRGGGGTGDGYRGRKEDVE